MTGEQQAIWLAGRRDENRQETAKSFREIFEEVKTRRWAQAAAAPQVYGAPWAGFVHHCVEEALQLYGNQH